MLKSANKISHEDGLPDRATAGPLNRVALLLAGGDGMRLRELTREIAGVPIPKQYCRLLRGSSLLEATLSRALLFAQRGRINAVVNKDHLWLAEEQLAALPRSNIFVQPHNLDTGPGLIFSLLNLERTYQDAIVAVFPTDHYVDSDGSFIAHALRAANAISQMPDKIALLGVTPDRPETGYGYILPAAPVVSCKRAFNVRAFTEKPSLLTARDIISRGGLWNTFVMVFRLSRMLELLSELVPYEMEKMAELNNFPGKAPELYKTLTPWNLSTQVLARIPQHLLLLEVADVRWSDWGTRESVERTYRRLNLAPFWTLSTSASNAIPG